MLGCMIPANNNVVPTTKGNILINKRPLDRSVDVYLFTELVDSVRVRVRVRGGVALRRWRSTEAGREKAR